jgi:hypothetical protein
MAFGFTQRNYSVRQNHTTPNGMDGLIILLIHKNPSRTVRSGGILAYDKTNLNAIRLCFDFESFGPVLLKYLLKNIHRHGKDFAS